MTDARLMIEGRPGGVALRGPGPWLLGRGSNADIGFPDDRLCSREQARIVRDQSGFRLETVPSAAETSLDGRVVTGPVRLHDGAVIGFGVQRLRLTLLDDTFDDVTIVGRSSDAVVGGETIVLDRNLTVGRLAMPGQVVLAHPAVSRRHAGFDVANGSLVVRDLGSANGTFVNGERIARGHRLELGDRVDIGPFQLTFDGHALRRSTRIGNVELAVAGVGFDVKARGGRMRILDGATFYIRPREFVCIIGSSGSGKSTLMNILAGRAIPSSGAVRLNGADLHRAFDSLKQDIAFVPQQDVLHEQLSLRQALDYAARLRLPPDTPRAQRQLAIEDAARAVDLSDRLDTRIALLSGGQKKRASLASEILNRPSLLFLDEVTSGLDESTDAEIMRLLRRLADEGMTIIVVTHTLANVEAFCHKVICMGRGGHTVFVGAPDEALGFFGVQRLGEIFNRIEDDGVAAWRERYEENALQTAVSRDAPLSGPARPAPLQARAMPRQMRVVMRQFAILTHRNARLLLADRRTLLMAAVQSSLIGGLMGYAFGSFGVGPEVVAGKNAFLFLLGLTSIWLGCNGASKDIVGELVIYQRERDINLSTAAFVAAKYGVTGLFTTLQLAIVFLLAAALAGEIPGRWSAQFAILVVGGLAGTAIGLLISAASNTRDQATTIVPLALVPQIILAGILVPHLPAPADWFARIAVSSFWLTEAMKSVFIVAEGPIRVVGAQTGRMVDMTAEPALLGVAIVALHAVVFLVMTYLTALLRHGGRTKGA